MRPNSDLPALRRLGAQHGFEVIDVNEWVQSHDVATVRWTAATSTPKATASSASTSPDYLLAHDLK